MRDLLKFFVLVGFIIGIVSCSAYHIQVTGYLDRAHSPSLVPGNTVFVMQNPEADNPLLEKEVAARIAKLLEQHGYRLSSPKDADFHILSRYGIDCGPLRTGSIAIKEPDRHEPTYTYDSDSGAWSFGVLTIPGQTRYVPYSVQHHTCWFSIRVIDVRKSRESHKAEVVWAADTVSEGKSTDLRDVLNYILVATFEYFGLDTGKAVRIKLKPGDSRVRNLKEK